MISKHIKRGFWLWIGLCLVVWLAAGRDQFAPYSNAVERIAGWSSIFGAALLAIAGLIARSREQAGAGKRLTSMYQRIQSGEAVEIRGESGLIRLLVGLGFAALLLHDTGAGSLQDHYPIRYALLVGALAAAALLEALTVLPLLRQPTLRISRDGLESPAFGKLSWNDIDGIDLSEVEVRWIHFQHRLHLLILRLPNLLDQMHPTTRLKQRMLSAFRPSTQLRLRLKGTSEMPKVILALCQRLSSEYTSNPTLWNQHMPAQQLVEQRREALARRERDRQEIIASVEGGTTRAAAASAHRAAKPKSKSQLEFEAKFKNATDANGFLEAMGSLQEENRKRRDESWELRVSPPRIPTHWTTWVTAAVVAAGTVSLIYLLYSSGA